MARHLDTSLVFDEEDVQFSMTDFLPRLIRVIFYRLMITNNDYLDRYHRYAREANPHNSPRDNNNAATADRRSINEDRLTFTKMQHVIEMMGFDITGVTIRLRDKQTGQERTFSTDDSVEDLNRQIQSERDITLNI